MLLLDTCTLLWLASDPALLSDRARQEISDASDTLFFSAISALEIGIKAAKGKLVLPLPVDEWIASVARHHGLKEIAITARVAALATLLPPHHRDPADRILLATAREADLLLLSPDAAFRRYDQIRCAW